MFQLYMAPSCGRVGGLGWRFLCLKLCNHLDPQGRPERHESLIYGTQVSVIHCAGHINVFDIHYLLEDLHHVCIIYCKY